MVHGIDGLEKGERCVGWSGTGGVGGLRCVGGTGEGLRCVDRAEEGLHGVGGAGNWLICIERAKEGSHGVGGAGDGLHCNDGLHGVGGTGDGARNAQGGARWAGGLRGIYKLRQGALCKRCHRLR